MIDAGVEIAGISFTGDAPDLGAWEYVLQTALNTTGEDLPFLIWPNPVKNYVFISSKSPVAIKGIRLFDLAGLCIRQYSGRQLIVKNGQTRLPVAGLQQGIYLLKINVENDAFVFQFLKE
jgi:hypothetical protein